MTENRDLYSLIKNDFDDLKFLEDTSKIFQIEIENPAKLLLISLILDAPFKLIVKKGIYETLSEVYEEINTARILTKEEQKILNMFKSNDKRCIDFINYLVSEYKGKKGDNTG